MKILNKLVEMITPKQTASKPGSPHLEMMLGPKDRGKNRVVVRPIRHHTTSPTPPTRQIRRATERREAKAVNAAIRAGLRKARRSARKVSHQPREKGII